MGGSSLKVTGIKRAIILRVVTASPYPGQILVFKFCFYPVDQSTLKENLKLARGQLVGDLIDFPFSFVIDGHFTSFFSKRGEALKFQ